MRSMSTMTYPAGFNMPGAFYSEGAGVTVSQQPPIFHSSPTYSEKPAPSSTPKRKRARGADSSVFSGSREKPQTPIRSYTLAGNLDTPAGGELGADSDVLEDSLYSESNYRTSFGSKRIRDDDDDSGMSGGPTSLFQFPAQPDSPSRGWSAAMGAIGGVVGKVWQFCKAGAFKGFYAGGGQGYAMTADGHVSPDDAPPAGGEYTYSFNPQHFDDYDHRIPGRFPISQSDSHHQVPDADAMDSSRASTPGPSAKRRQTAPANELRGSWVIVKDTALSPAPLSSTPRSMNGYRASPRNRNHGPSVATGRRINPASSRRNSVNTVNTYHFDGEDASHRPPSSASYASPRSGSPPKTPFAHTYTSSSAVNIVSTASTASAASPAAHWNSQSRTPTHRRRGSQKAAPSPHQNQHQHRRNHSTASAASSRGDEMHAVEASPRLDAEAKHLAARRHKEERDADFRISAFNKQLQDMIRQGREALGTTIEIDEGGDGWEDAE